MSVFPSIANHLQKILRDCGAILLDCQSSGKTGGRWAGEQYKAEADLIAHDYLVTRLGECFPGLPVVSEEDDTSLGHCEGDHLIIDPVDGTASFAQGFSGWVTQAAYVRENKPIVAGIYAPVTKEYFSAITGEGTYCNDYRLLLTKTKSKAKTIIDNYPTAQGITQMLQTDLNIAQYVESGSIALKICRVASQNADIFFKHMSPRDWDVAAPMLVLKEAGGILTDIDGLPLELGSPGRSHHGLVAAANTVIANQVYAWVRSRKEA